MAIKPYYQKKDITKEEYKDILRKAVHKVGQRDCGDGNLGPGEGRRVGQVIESSEGALGLAGIPLFWLCRFATAKAGRSILSR